MITVLVVDDDVYVGRLHCEYVNAVPGFRALAPARDIRAARAVLAAGGVDLVLADCILPDGSGVELIREADVDALMLSAVRAPQTVRAALRAGALAYVFKPFEAAALQDVLRRYVRLRRAWERGDLDQAALDRALAAFHDARAVEPSPSSTTRRILEVVDGANMALSALDVAQAVGVSRATAQRHLAKLAEARTISVELQYGSTGRPEHLYSTSGRATE